MNEKVVLAYSGGLDTSVILQWLIEAGYDVIARKEGSNIVAHGATGKGNDQVRFEMTYYVLMPEVRIISPWKDEEFLQRFSGRTDMINYAKEKGIPIPVTAEKPYSSDENMMHISYEAGVLEDPKYEPDKDIFIKTKDPEDAPDSPEQIMIEFNQGIPVKVENLADKTIQEDPVELFQYLNMLAGKHGIGRVDMVENRFVGMKSRGVYETPGGTILLQAHLDLEGLTMDREVKLLRDSLIPKYAQLIYFGFWYSPEMQVLETLMDKAQEYVSGRVYLKLYKGNVIIQGRESNESLYDEEIASMDVHGDYDQSDASGFIKLNALRLKASAKRKRYSLKNSSY